MMVGTAGNNYIYLYLEQYLHICTPNFLALILLNNRIGENDDASNCRVPLPLHTSAIHRLTSMCKSILPEATADNAPRCGALTT